MQIRTKESTPFFENMNYYFFLKKFTIQQFFNPYLKPKLKHYALFSGKKK